MQDNPNTDNKDNTDDPAPFFDMDCGDWELAFEPLKGDALRGDQNGIQHQDDTQVS